MGVSVAKRKSYDDKFRSSAVIMLEAAGYPNRKGALSDVAKHIAVPAMTLSRWFHGKQNPPPNQMVSEKRSELKDLISTELDAIFKAMPNARQDATYKDLGTVAGILMDKKQLLEGKPTERVEHTLTDDERANRITALLDAGRTRRDGQVTQRTDD